MLTIKINLQLVCRVGRGRGSDLRYKESRLVLTQVTSVFSYTRGKSSAATFLMAVNAPVELPITSRFVFDVLSIITN